MYSPKGLVSAGVRQDTNESNYPRILPANRYILGVEPRGFEPLTSAVQRRRKGFAVVHYCSKNRLNKPNPRYGPSRMFAVVRLGCRQTVVNCRRSTQPDSERSIQQLDELRPLPKIPHRQLSNL